MSIDQTTTESPLVSNRLRTLSDRIEQGEAGVLDAFWIEVEAEGTPLIERDAEQPDRCLVTFLWRETEPTEAVLVRELVTWLPNEQRQMQRLPNSDLWYLSWYFHPGVRNTYEFVVRLAGSSDDTSIWLYATGVPDPLNKHREASDWQDVADPADLQLDSILVLPDAEPLPWLVRDPAIATGTVSEHQFVSQLLGNERRVWVYEPAERPVDEPLGFMLIFDGEKHHSATTILDNLIAAGRIPPLAAIFVHQLDIRSFELTCNPTFSRAMVEELVPWARETFNLTSDPERTIINGRSFGGLCSAYTALKHPDVFGNVLMQSGSCWYHPDVILGYRTSTPFGPDEVYGVAMQTPTIITDYVESPRVPLRIYQEVGSHELGPPPTRWWQIFASRHFRDVVRSKGYDFHYREYNGGHDDAWWRGTLADGLLVLTSDWT